jgi:importin subunit alpha-1
MAERYIPEHRRTTFKAKNTFKPEELRRRREEQQVEIRKAKREENLAKRRGIGGDGSARLGASLGAEADSDDDTVPTESQVSSSHSFVCNVYSEHTIEIPALCKARRLGPLPLCLLPVVG